MRGFYISLFFTLAVISALVGKIDNLSLNFENQIKNVETRLAEKQNIYTFIWTGLELAELSTNDYADQLIKAFNESTFNEFGDGNVKVAMLWFKEQNPNINPDDYRTIKSLMEAVFEMYESDQKLILNLNNDYNESKITMWIMFFVIILIGMYNVGINYYIVNK
ncbi:MAG: hypothetical protein V3575_01020 [Candidatus Absconditabacteria bacterium]